MSEKNLSPENQNLAEKKLAIIQQLWNLITIVDNPVAVSNMVLDIVEQHIDAEKCSLMMHNDKNELHIVAARGFDEQFIERCRVRINEGTIGAAAAKCLPVYIKDIKNQQMCSDQKEDCHCENSLISCSISYKGNLLGILNLHDKRGNVPFSDEEYELAQVIANNAGNVINNLLLLNQLKINAAELEMTNQRLIDMDLKRTEFLMSLSHEIRTPLNAIKGSIYHLDQASNIGIGERKEFYSIIMNETHKLLVFVENQMDLLMSRDISRQLNTCVVDLSEIIKRFAKSKFMLQLKKKKSFKLLVNTGEGISSICGDKTIIAQLFQHLTEGLSFFLNKDDTLQISVDDGDSVHVKFLVPVKLPEAQIPNLFDVTQIYRKNDYQYKIKLYLAKKIIELHRWSNTARNIEDHFELSIVIPKNKRQMIDAAVRPSANLLLEIVSESLGIDSCSLMLNDDLTGELTIKSALGLDDDIVRNTRIKVGDKISGWVALEGKPLLIDNIENAPHFGKLSSNQYNTKSLMSIPLKVNGKVIGVLNMNNKKSGEPFTEKDLHLAMVFVERFAQVMGKLQENDIQEKNVEQLLSSLSRLLDAQKIYHKKQAQFPDLVEQIMERLEVTDEERQLALYVSTTYDLGLMLLNPELLKKKNLQVAEMNALRVHPYTTLDLLNCFEFSEEVKKAILHHHERFDGSGYPDGLQGEKIPIISRVIAVVDAFCAMISKRPYRHEVSITEALKEIRSGSGTFYDPCVVHALEAIFETGMKLFGNAGTRA